jgi:hypothetical protein
MKIEITEEKKFNEPTWYFLRVDGITLECSKELGKMETLYDQIKANPEIVLYKKIILKSEEIDVNL